MAWACFGLILELILNLFVFDGRHDSLVTAARRPRGCSSLPLSILLPHARIAFVLLALPNRHRSFQRINCKGATFQRLPSVWRAHSHDDTCFSNLYNSQSVKYSDPHNLRPLLADGDADLAQLRHRHGCVALVLEPHYLLPCSNIPSHCTQSVPPPIPRKRQRRTLEVVPRGAHERRDGACTWMCHKLHRPLAVQRLIADLHKVAPPWLLTRMKRHRLHISHAVAKRIGAARHVAMSPDSLDSSKNTTSFQPIRPPQPRRASPSAMATPAAELWLYLDAATGQQKGPVPAPIVKKLLRKGILQPQQLVWTQRLSEWTAISSVEPFAAYCRVWAAVWFYMAENLTDPSTDATRTGPVTTQQLVTLFVDGQVDGMTLVWSQELDGWKPIGEVPSLKEFLQEANDDLDREQELHEQTSEMPVELQVFEKESTDALVAEDGKRYVFDAESKTYVTPEDKIEEELTSLQQAMVEANAEKEAIDQQSGKDNSLEGNSDSESTEKREVPVTAVTEAEVTDQADAEAKAAKKRKKKKKKNNKWKKSKNNTWVYVNGLPLDVTVQEVHDHFAKCGVIQSDITTGEPRIKLYQNKEDNGLNGDGSVCYMKEASVELSVQLLDKSQIRPEWPIDVSPAEFKQKGQDFVKQKKPKIDTRAKIKMFEKEKALSWNEGEVSEPAGLRIVVIKHMFTPAEIEDEAYEKELQEDIHDECSKIGEVSKITLFAKHVDGVVVIKFASSGSAAKCVEVMNGRFFAGRKLECGFWEGTDYTYRESNKEEKERADKFQEWLEEGSSSSDSEGEDETKEVEQPKKVETGEEAHTGRQLPPLGDVSDDSDVESNSDADDDTNAATGATEMHSGRAMPDLDDLGDDEGDK